MDEQQQQQQQQEGEACSVVVNIDIIESDKRRQAGRRKRSKDKRCCKVENITNFDDELERCEKRSQKLTLTDVKIVSKQLGYHPHNIIEVAAYSSRMSPLVVKLYPLHGNAITGRYRSKKGSKAKQDFLPFPTMLWVSCPNLHAQISHLEDLGFITQFQKRVNEDDSVLESMRQAHNFYAEERWSLLSSEDKTFVEEKNWFSN